MTRAPSNLLAARTLLLTHLDNAPGPDDLEPAEVGIVGDSAHRGGYHCGSDRVVPNDYSVVESPRDRAGLTLDAAALDVGQFSVTSGGRTHTLPSFSVWCVGECVKNAPDTRDIREIIYSPDGTTVKRWDRLGKRTSGDSSHRWHTHFSFFRDAIEAGRDQRPLFRRYLQHIGLIEGGTTVTMSGSDKMAWATTNRADALLAGKTAVYQIEGEKTKRTEPNRLMESLVRIEKQLATLSGKDFTNEPEIIAGVLRGMTPEMFAQAFVLSGWTPAEFAAALPKNLADEMIVALGRELSQ